MLSLRSRKNLFSLAAFGALGAFMVPSQAQAQTTGWSLDRYEPTPVGDPFFASEHPTYTGGRTFAFRAGLTFDYAHNPLVVRATNTSGGEDVTRVVSDMAVLHIQAAIALWDRLGINLSLPLGMYQAGERSVAGLSASSAAALGDIRLGARVRLFGEADRDPVSLHLGAQLFINAGALGVAPGTMMTDDGFRGRFNATLAGRGGPVRWSFGLGAHLRQRSLTVAGTDIGSDLFANAALGFVALDNRLTVGPELWASTVLADAFEQKHLNVEALLGAHYLIADTILVGAGIGPGLTYGAGTPAWRGLLNVAYAPANRVEAPPPPADTDNDGVIDPDDVCPTTPQGAHPDPTRRGCPLADTDNDGVFDNEDQCVTEPQGANPDPARRGCPRRDTDGDGVFDDEDQCVNEPQGATPDPDRRGCPDGDEDHDGVLNHVDQCRTVPQGPYPDPERAGCPIPDRDCDTVADAVDRCPDQPGVPSSNPARNGCPNGLTIAEYGQIRILRPVNFATNSADVASVATNATILNAVAEALRASTSIRRMSVEGHTDDVGNDGANQDLSNRRAESVMNWLVAHGIDASRLESHGFGESRPLVPIAGMQEHTVAIRGARAQNRRVMFIVVDPPLEGGTTGGPGGSSGPRTEAITRPGCVRQPPPSP